MKRLLHRFFAMDSPLFSIASDKRAQNRNSLPFRTGTNREVVGYPYPREKAVAEETSRKLRIQALHHIHPSKLGT